jgi:hypothetical protein
LRPHPRHVPHQFDPETHPLSTCDLPPEHVIEWDVATWSRALPLWEAAAGPSLAGKRGLEIGSRGGGLSLWMARKGCE